MRFIHDSCDNDFGKPMTKRTIRTALTVVTFMLIGAAPVLAQATRTWVSGVGDDANPCSRTAPCKTFAGTISKTAANGEINVLDPGEFGAVTITKSITLNGNGFNAGITNSAGNGITINAAATDNVRLLNLQLNGMGTGVVGIQFNTGAGLVVDNVSIHGFSTGIETMVGMTTVDRSLITKNSSLGVNSRGTSALTLKGTLLVSNNVGVQATDTSTLRLSNNGIYNNGAGVGCGGGTIASTGDNRKGGNGAVVVTCLPTQSITAY
jgi:hypothetical protein